MIKNLLFFIAAVSFTACGNNQVAEADTVSKDTAKTAIAPEPEPGVDLTIPALPDDYIKIDLSKIGLNATVMAPKETDIQRSTLHDNEGERDQYLILPFRVLTGNSDFDEHGGISAEIDIFTTERTLQQYKEIIQYSTISSWNKFVKEDASYIIYTTKPGNTSNQPLRANDKDVYHFLMLVKSKKDNKQYCIRSESFDLTSDEMLKLFAIAKTIEL